MEIRLSVTHIRSFVGDVLPLRLLGAAEYGMEHIEWAAAAGCVQITAFDQAAKDPFTDGVLLTLLEEGEAWVTATYRNETYSCRVCVHERMHTPSQKGLAYFIGSFHDHTAKTHDREQFPLRKEGIPADYLRQIAREGLLEATVISDHADLLTDKEFFRGYWDAFCMEDSRPVVFPGSEAEVSPLWDDRYGVEHKLGGEIVVINTDSYASAGNWEKFFSRYQTSPFAIGILAHPQVIGISRKGIWNFALDRNRTPKLLQLLRGVEMGDGSDRDSNLINEYTYSVALDNGFRVSTTCSSDRHGPEWAGGQYPGKTILMAPERSKEAFLDALDSCRFYASESGNVKLYYEVNGQAAPGVLKPADTYRFRLEMGLLKEVPGDMPVRLQLISDYGKTIWETDAVEPVMEFAVSSQTARWFYLRLTDAQGKHTWSVPVWTGREFDGQQGAALTPVAKAGMTALEETEGTDAAVLLNDDPGQPFFANSNTCSILLDMGKVQKLAALGVYHIMLDVKALRAAGLQGKDRLTELPAGYRLETGLTLETMRQQAEGVFRVFGGEELIAFPKHEARYVRLRILSNVGTESGRPNYKNCRVGIAELTPML